MKKKNKRGYWRRLWKKEAAPIKIYLYAPVSDKSILDEKSKIMWRLKEIMLERRREKRYLIFLLGGLTYYKMETAFRGYSHWTMAIAGGVCCLFLWDIFYGFGEMGLWRKAALGAFAITLVELAAGIVVNILLRWQVWDYSDLPYHLLGQVCPWFSLIWFGLAVILFWGMRKAIPS